MITLINNAYNYPDRIAIKSNGADYTYQDLLDSSERIAQTLLNGRKDLNEARIGFIMYVSNGLSGVQEA